DNPRQKLDLFLPEKPASEGPLPVIVFIHGGGWKNGDKSSGGGKVAPLVATGKYAGASIGYRLSDEARWPSQIHDCKAGIRWLRAHAKEYGLDPDRIAVWGTSAGGHLVAMLGVSQGVEGLEGEIGSNLDQSSRVTCVLDFFGPTELLTMGDHPSTIQHNSPESPESKLIGGALQEHPDRAKSASPIEHVTQDDAPTLIVHGTEDPLVPFPQSVDFEKKLEAAGVPVILMTVEGGGHGKGFGPSVNTMAEAYLAKQLLGESREVADTKVKAGE
ncbi:MAG: alpha/beta hydrolase, partial [Verrucomicrobiae bacterium]|nr:alpha/beta hydrolase [Verrucomicrobiae bacterium]